MTTIEIIEPRQVLLGAGDSTEVARVLPQRSLSMIGAWCFLDHFGPEDVTLRVPPHPHTCLQTVTWLFSGAIRHRDALGTDVVVRPGEVNLMTAGWGITHTEYAESEDLHGVQLWTALPAEHRFCDPRFEQFATGPVRMADHEVAVFVGELGGVDSPVRVHTGLVGAEIRFNSSDELAFDINGHWEYGVLADGGAVEVDGVEIASGQLGYLAPGRPGLTLRAHPEDHRVVRAIVLGGAPLNEDIVMWWNFVGRSHDEIVAWRANWQAGIGAEDGGDNPNNFPLTPPTDGEGPLAAPGLPSVRLRPRSSRHPGGRLGPADESAHPRRCAREALGEASVGASSSDQPCAP